MTGLFCSENKSVISRMMKAITVMFIVVSAASLSLVTPLNAPSPSIKLYGTQGSRSPLVNWYLDELSLPYTQLPPRPNPHPFNQVPCLTDSTSSSPTPIWESGAILLYIASKYDPNYDVSLHSPWVVFANSALDPICFREDANGRVLGTNLDKPNKKIDVLESMLSGSPYICCSEFSVADVAVASYLNYVPLFNGDKCTLRDIPNVVRYMERCAKRDKFKGAFGEQHQGIVLALCEKWINEGKTEGGGQNKLFGIF